MTAESSAYSGDPFTDGVLRLDAHLAVVSADAGAQRLLGGIIVPGLPVVQVLPDVPARGYGTGRRHDEWPSPARMTETMARRLDGAPFLAEITIVKDSASLDQSAVLVRIRDLSSLSPTEIEIRRRRLRNQQILEATRHATFVVDNDGRIDFANPAAASMLRRRATDFVDADLVEITGLARPDGTAFDDGESPVARTLSDGLPHEAVASSVVRRDDLRLDTETSCTPVREAGAVAGVVVIIADITERAAVQRRKDEFLSTISHELRTPLTSIRGSLGMLAGGVVGELPPDAARMVDIAMSNTHRLIRLVNDLLALERFASGRMPLQLEVVDLAEVGREVISLQEPTATTGEVRITTDLQSAVTVTDPYHVATAVTNFVSNAVKFSPPGGTVDVRTGGGEHDVWVSVRDQGRGIPPNRLDEIFERFAQVTITDANVMGGSGLGLSITAHIAAALGGRVGVESELGLGSTFTLYLPRRHHGADTEGIDP
ncbi:MAG: sensor histidine kinase [Nocardioidaceae bacterium]